MSWIFGVVYKNPEDNKKVSISKILRKKILFNYQSTKLQIFAGGNPSTLHHSTASDSKKGWVVSGIGIKNSDTDVSILKNDDWEGIIFNNVDKINTLDGHFVILNWDENRIAFHTDVLGLRDIYIKNNSNSIVFSTHIGLISKVDALTLNFEEFGSRWLMFNQLSANSIFDGVERIKGGQKCIIDFDDYVLKMNNFSWEPLRSFKPVKTNMFTSSIESLISTSEAPISLSLSGGMDSRVLLSLLLSKKNLQWDTHTFGNPKCPDSIIANRISRDLNIEHYQVNLGIPAIKEIINEAIEYTSLTLANSPASAVIQSRNYFFFHDKHLIIIDGGLGEIWRREFLNKLLWIGKRSLLNRNINSILRHLRLNRANIFSHDILEIMWAGCRKQLLELIHNLPDISDIGVENWLDIFAIKTRLVNYYSQEQTRLDGCVFAYMPFAQLRILQYLFSVPGNLRRNGNLFREIIKTKQPLLTKYHLAKGDITYPFNFTSIQSRLYALVKKGIKHNIYCDNTSHIFLSKMKEFILDTLHSKEIKEISIYDYGKVKKIIEKY